MFKRKREASGKFKFCISPQNTLGCYTNTLHKWEIGQLMFWWYAFSKSYWSNNNVGRPKITRRHCNLWTSTVLLIILLPQHICICIWLEVYRQTILLFDTEIAILRVHLPTQTHIRNYIHPSLYVYVFVFAFQTMTLRRSMRM